MRTLTVQALRYLGNRAGHGGFSLIELLAALAILTTAVLGLVGVFGLYSGGIASSFDSGQNAVSRGAYVSTATFLAQDRLEQVKRFQYAIGPPPVDDLGSGSPPASLPDEDYGTIAGYPDFRREVVVQDNTPVASMKQITVTVRFQRPSPNGVRNESMLLRMNIAAR